MKLPILKKLIGKGTSLFIVLLLGTGYLIYMNIAKLGSANWVTTEQSPVSVSKDDLTSEMTIQNSLIETPTSDIQLLSSRGKNITSRPSIHPILPTDTKHPIFYFDNLNQVPPDDVLQEVTWYGFGTGGEICKDNQKGPYLLWTQERVNWLTEIDVITCGWEPGEPIEIKVLDKSGNIIYSKKQLADLSEGLTRVVLWPGFDFEPGKVTIKIQGQSDAIEHNIDVVKPIGARFYRLLHQPYLILYNFAPLETIRIAAYSYAGNSSTAPLVAWQQYKTDENGQLFISIQDQSNIFYVAQGDVSGIFIESRECFLCAPIILDLGGMMIEPIP